MAQNTKFDSKINGYPKMMPKRFQITIPKKLVDMGIIDPAKDYVFIVTEKIKDTN